MITNCFKIGAGLKVTPIEFDQALAMAKHADTRIWLDVQGGEPDELESILVKLEIRDLAKRLCLESCERPGFYPLNSYIFLVIPVQAEATDFRDVEYISLLCSENLLLTLRNQRDSPLQKITTPEDSVHWLRDDSIAGFVSTFIMVMSLESMQQLVEIRQDITVLEKRMDREPDLVKVSEIFDIRSKLLTLEAVVSGQLPSFQALTTINKPFFKPEQEKEYLMSALANLEAASRSISWLEGRLEVIRSEIEMRSQDKMNRRLGRLTILSLLFMPMTFLAGIWGMNFNHMPELESPWGYPFALGLMAVIGSAMFFFFRKRGWFE